jgi:acetoin utilization deacetylase AcuC-like enzyme
VPTVVVQEGGYDLEAIGGLVEATLSGFVDGHPSRGSGPPRNH